MRYASVLDRQHCHTSSDNNVASPITAATKSVASNTTPARTHLPDCLAKTARKSAAQLKPIAPKRPSIQAKLDEKSQGGADPIILTESEDVPAPSRLKQHQRKSSVPQLKPPNGSVKGKGKTQGLQRDDPINLEPPDGISDISDAEMSIPAPRPRSSPNEPSPVSTKEEILQRRVTQAGPPSQLSNVTTRRLTCFITGSEDHRIITKTNRRTTQATDGSTTSVGKLEGTTGG